MALVLLVAVAAVLLWIPSGTWSRVGRAVARWCEDTWAPTVAPETMMTPFGPLRAGIVPLSEYEVVRFSAALREVDDVVGLLLSDRQH